MKKNRGYLIILHVICWLIFLSLPAVFVAGPSGHMKFSSLLKPYAWVYFTSYIFIFYLHTNILLPTFYFRKKYPAYFFSLALLGTAIFFLQPFDRLAGWDQDEIHQSSEKNEFKPPATVPLNSENTSPASPRTFPAFNFDKHEHGGRPKFDIISIILFILIIVLSITLVVIKRWRIAVEQAARAEADKAIAELAILKAQINPHFLFNTLNNIYSQAISQDEKTAESIMKLSNIMRYVTDDANEDFVSLISETDFISDYIELQRLRIGSKVTLDFSIAGNLSEKVIAPLILITFIENVFKYGISNNEPSVISIDLRAYSDSIGFFCRNKLFPLKHQPESTGIGIKNTKKRLEHLYPGRHSLIIKEEDGFYTVHLILQSKI